MKTHLLTLALGAVLGFFIHSTWFASPDLVKAIADAGSCKAPNPLVLNPSVRAKSAITPDPDPVVLARAQSQPEAPAEPAAKPERRLLVSVENLEEMEKQREKLRDYAYASHTPQGWRIQILPQDEVFMKAGLSSGDLITFESIDRQLRSPEQSELAARMVGILNTIQR